MASLFISYRRSDAEGWAGRLSDSLSAHLGRVNIFRDIEDIPAGVDFEAYITEAVGSCSALIALIGPHWLTVTDKAGRRRLDDPGDFTRLEIATALQRNVRVIPGPLCRSPRSACIGLRVVHPRLRHTRPQRGKSDMRRRCGAAHWHRHGARGDRRRACHGRG
jgi:hypothetical protein